MKIELFKSSDSTKNSVIVTPVFEDELPESLKDTPFEFQGDKELSKLFSTQFMMESGSVHLYLGAGKKDEFSYENIQNWSGTAVRALSKRARSAILNIPNIDNIPNINIATAIAIGATIADYDPSRSYKSTTKTPILERVLVSTQIEDDSFKKGLQKGQIIGNAINLIRRLGDMPPNDMTPTYFLDTVKQIATKNRLKITVIDETKAKKMGMGAFVGVAQGSEEPSYMIALEYNGNPKSKDKLALVGKGITFDTGGISIKPAAGMPDMKYDMMGAATVLGVTQAAAELKLKQNLVAVMAVTENLPGGRAQRPGDIVKTYSGKTAEILNTDAEGRLVLVDALTLAQKDYQATRLIDLATLTGAMIVSLGEHYTGVFSNNDNFANELINASKQVGERFWQMPMDKIFDQFIESKIADIANIGHSGKVPQPAGAITAAKFLEAVIEDDRPWIHLDIAGPADTSKSEPYRIAGATGVTVKTLIELIK